MAQFNDLIVDGLTALRGEVNTGSQTMKNTTSYGNSLDPKIHTSFSNNEIVNGSIFDEEWGGITIPNFINQIRNSHGGTGSLYVSAVYTLNSVTVSAGWYTFIWIPYKNGGPSNNTAGTLILSGMTVEGFSVIRYYNSTIQSIHKWY